MSRTVLLNSVVASIVGNAEIRAAAFVCLRQSLFLSMGDMTKIPVRFNESIPGIITVILVDGPTARTHIQHWPTQLPEPP